ncbi:MAG TPA: cytochrome b N-terminal domain-containing protein [Fimbriimonadaceae bacterium]|nr:cytochrome b N-terminal domain-containing protein [Fimbriimonadaceae bacterium]
MKDLPALRISAAALLLQVGLQFGVGLLLSRWYAPTLLEAHASVQALRDDAAGRVLVNLHYWGSALLIVHAFVHVSGMILHGLYAREHRWQWLSAVAALLCILGFQISGNLLPMDRHDVQTAVIEAGVASSVPGVGSSVSEAILAGPEFGQSTLDAWSIVHRWLLPGLLLVVCAVLWASTLRGPRFRLSPALLFLLPPIILAVALDAPAGSPATEADFTSYDARVGWYVWPMHGALNAFQRLGPGLGWIGAALIPGLFVGFLFALPWMAHRFARPLVTWIYLSFVAAFGFLALVFGGLPAPITGNQDPPAQAVGSGNVPLSDAGTAQHGRELFNSLPCSGCHGDDARGGAVKLNLAQVRQRHRSFESLMKFIQDPRSVRPGSTMPAFPQLGEEERRALAEFLFRQGELER